MESDVYLGDHFEIPKQKKKKIIFKMVKLGFCCQPFSMFPQIHSERHRGERHRRERHRRERPKRSGPHRPVWRKRVGGY